MHAHAHVYIYMYIYIYINVNVSIHMYIPYICVYTYMYTYVCLLYVHIMYVTRKVRIIRVMDYRYILVLAYLPSYLYARTYVPVPTCVVLREWSRCSDP